MRVSMLSFWAKRKLASKPVKLSGDIAARSSTAKRISSAQSMSSGAAVTKPKAKAPKKKILFRKKPETAFSEVISVD